MELDHLVYAVPDLDAAVDALAARFGVLAAPGGKHPGLGTRNALLALGPDSFLEIIGPSGDEPPRWFGLDSLRAPKLVAWAAKDARLQARADEFARAGLPLGPVESGSRQRPDGQLLQWRFTHPRVLAADGVLPFFIDWGGGPHPGALAPRGVSLVELRAEHPAALRLRALVPGLRIDPASAPRLVASLSTPRGPVVLS
jgi:Glyoxalase-like domain